MIPTLHMRLLGDFSLVSGDTPLTVANIARLQSLLAYLVLHRDSFQDRSRVAFLLWPDSTEAQAHSNLRKLLHQLRQTLPHADHFLLVDRHSLRWQPGYPDSSWTLDALDFSAALEQAEHARCAHDGEAQRQALERSLHLYRGDLLPACYDEWVLSERDRLRQAFFQAQERFIELLEEEGDYEAAIKVAQRLLHHDPLHEVAYRRLMHLYTQRGDRASAIRVYHTCATMLERELAIVPGEATRRAYEALLHMDASAVAVPSQTSPRSTRGVAAPLVGRKREWGWIQTAWRQAVSGQSSMIVLTGEAGIGKTRLAEEMLAWVSQQGMMIARAHCYAAEGRLAYAPVAMWLRSEAVQAGLPTLEAVWLTEVARLVPGVLARRPELPSPALMTESCQRQRFFEALAQAFLRTHQPLLLLLDDLQWCDDETLEWVHYLLRYEPRARLLLIGTVRLEEIRAGHPLEAFLRMLQREGLVTEMTLRALTRIETSSLAQYIASRPLMPAVIDKLYDETEGNPLFVVETVRAGTLEEREQRAVSGPLSLLTQSAQELPSMVQTVLAQLSPGARELASLAAVIGREFSFAVLARASAENEATLVQGLDELWQRRIVREQGEDTYDFSHTKLREAAYASLSRLRRRLLHGRVAEALAQSSGYDLDTSSQQIAAHYEQAGRPEEAIPYYQRAGEVARRVYANAQAIEFFKRAITLLSTPALSATTRREQPREMTARLYESLGDTLEAVGRHEEARQTYQQAIAWIAEQEYIWHARFHWKIGRTWEHPSILKNRCHPISRPNASWSRRNFKRMGHGSMSGCKRNLDNCIHSTVWGRNRR